MANIHEIMAADSREVLGKVEIVYSDLNDDSLLYTASESGRYTYPEQLMDSVTDPFYKWFSLHDNKLDGSYHPLSGDKSYSTGWWGNRLSQSDGSLIATQTDFKGKVAGSTAANPNLLRASVAASLVAPTGAEWVQLGYDQIKVLDGTSAGNITLVNGGIAQEIFSFDLIAHVERKYGTIIGTNTADKVAWLKANVTKMICNCWCHGSSPVGNKATLARWKHVGAAWHTSSVATNTAATPGKLSTVMEIGEAVPPTNSIDSDGFVHFIVYADASNGTTASIIRTDYVDLTVELAPPNVMVAFSSRTIFTMTINGDSKLNIFPVDFVIRLYGIGSVLLGTHIVTGNTDMAWSVIIPPVPNVIRAIVSITKINQPGVVVKLTEIGISVKETYYNDIIESIQLLEEVGYSTGGLPTGNISANELDISLSNIDRRFDINNIASYLYGYIQRNRRVRAWLGAKVDGELQWYPLGTFWTTTWNISNASNVATLTARDRLELLRLSDFRPVGVYTNRSLYYLFEEVLKDAGLLADEYDIDTALNNIVVPYAWFTKMKHRQALSRIAESNIIQVYCTREGRIRVNLNLDASPDVVTTFDDDTNVNSSSFPLAVGEQVNHVEVTSKQWTVSANKTLCSYTEILSIAPGETVTRSYNFDVEVVYSVDTPTYTKHANIAVLSVVKYTWGMDITFKNNGASAASVSAVSVTGTTLEEVGTQVMIAEDAESIRNSGVITVSISHDFIQSQTRAQALANEVLDVYNKARYDVTLSNRGDIALQLGDKVNVVDARYNVITPYVVTRQTVRWNGFLDATTEGKKL